MTMHVYSTEALLSALVETARRALDPYKTCTKCGERKCVTGFHRYTDRAGETRHRASCKACHQARYSTVAGYVSPSRQKQIEAFAAAAVVREAQRQAKPYECILCHDVKPRSEFGCYPGGSLSKSCLVCVDARRHAKIERPCKGCGVVFADADLRWGRCSDCFNLLPHRSKEYREAERAKAAAKKGKTYSPAAPGEKRRSLADIERARLKQERIAAERAQREAQRQADIERYPWRDPSLSDAEAFRLQYRLDPEFNLKQRMRAALKRKRQGIRLAELFRDAIYRQGTSPRAEAFAGYSTADLKRHLERQFTKGMTWQAFCEGRIHIDHIVPLSSFDLSNPDELKAAWALTNLRPLWGKDNLCKAASRVHLI